MQFELSRAFNLKKKEKHTNKTFYRDLFQGIVFRGSNYTQTTSMKAKNKNKLLEC